MLYKMLEMSKGPEYMRHVWNLVFKPLEEDAFFVQPHSSGALADCAEFWLNRENDASTGIYFFVNDTTLVDFLRNVGGQLYLYGAYNQVSVCQMRAKGSVTCEVDNPQIASIRERIRTRITNRINVSPNKLSESEARDRFRIIDEGQFFCFRPVEYAYEGYERG